MARHARAVFGLISACFCGIAVNVSGQAPSAATAAVDTAASHARAAEQVLVVTHAERQSQDMIAQMFQSMSKAAPAGSPAISAMRNVMLKYMSFDAMKPDMIKAYTATYSESELNQISAFYQTDMGRMIVDRTPKIMTTLQAISAERLRAMQPELMRAMQQAVMDQNR